MQDAYGVLFNTTLAAPVVQTIDAIAKYVKTAAAKPVKMKKATQSVIPVRSPSLTCVSFCSSLACVFMFIVGYSAMPLHVSVLFFVLVWGYVSSSSSSRDCPSTCIFVLRSTPTITACY